LIYESICTQTDTKTHADVAIETDEAVAAQKEPMPVLKMEAPIKMPHVYEDLSDDEPTELLMKPSTIPTSSAAAALFGIAQASSSAGGTPNSIIQRPATSTPVTSRMNPSMTNVNMNVNVQLNSEKKKQQQQQHQQQHLNQIQKSHETIGLWLLETKKKQ
uniref:Uncharacterized protein n=2 Tax=Caenorhabditis japonica TaxID=281687 RepID=A0A8R1IHY7_CAEJA